MPSWLTKKVMGWIATVVGVLVLLFIVGNWWDNATAWLPWSDESKLARTEQRAVQAETQATTQGVEAEAKEETYVREREYIMQQPIIIRQAEQGSAAIRAASGDRAASDAFIDSVCKSGLYSDSPRCVQERDAASGS